MTETLPADRLPCPWQDEDQSTARLREQLAGKLDWSAVRRRCEPWIQAVRQHPGAPWALESLLHEFPLSSQEGLAMMRLAEALLRVPDPETAMALTADQLNRPLEAAAPPDAGWLSGLTHRVLALSRHVLPAADHGPTGWLQRLGGPALVAATTRSLQLLGQQFVLGQTVDEALATARQQRTRAANRGQRWCYSLDMLGEGARTHADAARYLASYRQALDRLAIEQADAPSDQPRDSLSIKLSALHPRLDPLHVGSFMADLLPSLIALTKQALAKGISITLDAEESWRLELQLHVLDCLLGGLSAAGHAPAENLPTVGLAVQAYQHRAPEVIEEVARLARLHGRRINVRLVKGAYWDSEVKRAQELGLPGFAVFTQKANTDLSYVACARQLLSHGPWLRPQFATHNAATVAAVLQLAALEAIPASELEWQRLHGMGESVWREILADPEVTRGGAPVLRIYAPVGSHRDLLAYLVRRLLENGANASFIHQLVDPHVSLDTLLTSPLVPQHSLPAVRSPRELHGHGRLNAQGRDLHHVPHRIGLEQALLKSRGSAATVQIAAAPPVAADAATAMRALHDGWGPWAQQPLEARCLVLEKAAQALESDLDSWAADLVIEAHKTWFDAVSEVRETIDYARYYAQQARDWLSPRLLPGPTGERNEWLLRPRGVWVCIAPWNFPLAIFGGQVMAALVTGNAVAAKPAPQTPRIARRLVSLLHDMGVPDGALTCLPGGAHMGNSLVGDRHCAGVVFTGSQATARLIQQTLVQRPEAPIVPLIAETGGLNALIADSSALPEQLIDSVLSSAFGSAGQRCSALRLLCVYTALAKDMEALLAGAMATLVVDWADAWETDIGPVIDEQARTRLLGHVQAMDAACLDPKSGVRLIGQARQPPSMTMSQGCFVIPRAYAINQVADLKEEHFGPLLHVVRWGPGTLAPTLDELIDQINASGHGLTLGVHTRIDSRAEQVAHRIKAGNVYVNRGMTGAVVGVQPFGGQGLSGTGPKAGGPLYLPRFCTEQVVCTNTAAAGGDALLMSRAG